MILGETSTIPSLETLQACMEAFENNMISESCMYGCASCGIMVFENKDFNMNMRGKTLRACQQYFLTSLERIEYSSMTSVCKKTDNVIVVGNDLIKLHLKYIRPYDATHIDVVEK